MENLCQNCTWLLSTAHFNLIENVLIDFSKNVLSAVPFSFTTNVAPYSLKKIRLYTRDSSDDFRKSLIHEMYRCQCMILMGINILASVVICSIVNSLFNISTLREKKQVLQCTNSKIHFVKRNFHLLKI